MRAEKTCASGDKIASRLQGVRLTYLDVSLGVGVCALHDNKKLRIIRDAEQATGFPELLMNWQISPAALLTSLQHWQR